MEDTGWTNERLGVLLCGVGGAILALVGLPGERLAPTMAICAALAGIAIVTGARPFRFAVPVPLVAFFFANLWAMLPSSWIPDPAGGAHALPGMLAWLLVVSCVLASLPLAARRIGWGLPAVTLAFLLVALVARALRPLLLLGDARDPERLLAGLALDGSVGLQLAGACWIALALAPLRVPEIRSRGLAMLGAIGAASLAARLGGYAEQGQGRLLFLVSALGVSWLLVVAGIAGVARSGGRGLAWAGFVLGIVQMLVCPAVIGGVGERTAVGALLAMSIGVGALGLALAALSRDLPLRLLRTVAGALFLAVMLGSCAENVGAWLDISHVVHIGGEPAFWWPARVVAGPALHLGLVLWAALLALMADPPREPAP